MNHGFAGDRLKLVVLAQPTGATEPAEGALDDPAPGQNLEASHVVGALDDLERGRAERSAQSANPIDQLTVVSAIGPEVSKSQPAAGKTLQQKLGPVAILHVGWMHHDFENQSERVGQKVSLATTDVLARVVTGSDPDERRRSDPAFIGEIANGPLNLTNK